MSMLETGRNAIEAGDRAAMNKEEEAVEVASQWAQEKLENFLLEVERNGNDHKQIKISYIISRRTSIDVFTGKTSDIGSFAKNVIGKLADGKVMESIGDIAGTLLNKLMGSAAGSAQSEQVYEVTFDELGGLNRLDAYFFCYRFASSGLVNFNKAVIGTCIVRSAALMVDDNAYRVVLTSSATLEDKMRADISAHMIEVAKNQKRTLDEDGNMIASDPALMEARAKLAQVIGEGVATSTEHVLRKTAMIANKTPFSAANAGVGAEKQAGVLSDSINTVVSSEDAAKAVEA